MTVDVTPPTTGYVYDGLELDDDGNDMKYSSKPATVSAHWTDFEDPESNVTSITVDIIVNGEVQEVCTFCGYLAVWLGWKTQDPRGLGSISIASHQ